MFFKSLKKKSHAKRSLQGLLAKIVAIHEPGGRRNLDKNTIVQQITFNKTIMETQYLILNINNYININN